MRLYRILIKPRRAGNSQSRYQMRERVLASLFTYNGRGKGAVMADTSLRQYFDEWKGAAGGVPTTHGLRTNFSTFCKEVLRADPETAEMCLAHYPKGVRGDYMRGQLLEQRRVLHEAWAKHLEKIVPLRRSA
jgi:integrase